jgi:hypothetical protein
MASSEIVGPFPPYDFGSSVRWRRGAATLLEGSICGFRLIRNAEQAKLSGFPEGTVLALVEGQSGDACDVPLSELELA